MNIKFIDMFCGIGGFRLGLEKANTSKQESGKTEQVAPRIIRQGNRGRVQPVYRCVWSNDNDRYACQIYRKHFGEVCEQDIRTVAVNGIPNHNLLCAGFPCQSFSIAGKRGGFEDTRGTLFFEICRVLRAKRPSYLFLENVKGLLSHDDGTTFQTIIGTLDELGYDCQWQVLNSKDYGVPQNRERVFIVGHLRGKPRPKIFPIGEAGKGIIERADEATSIRTLQGGGHSGGHHSGMTLLYEGAIMSGKNQKWLEDGKELSRNFPQGQRVYSTEGIASSICGDAGGLGGKTGLYEVAQALQTDGQLRQGVSWGTDKPQSARNIRRLTPLECERLQGFPDGWTEGISDTQRYKCLGNAVTVNVIEAIGRQMVMELKE